MIDARSIVRGALTRTLPGALLGYAGLIGLSGFVRSNLSAATLALTIVSGLAIAGGSALALLAMRSRLTEDAGVAGRRAVLVGLGGFCLGLTTRPFLHFVNPAGSYVVMGAAGAVLAVAMFFPWLQSKTSATLASGLDGDLQALTAPPIDTVIATRQRSVVRDV